jgi:hypothetical protein
MNANILKILVILALAPLTVSAQIQQQVGRSSLGNVSQLATVKDDLKRLLEFTDTPPAALNKSIGAPGTSFGAPSAYAASKGQGFIGLSGIYDYDGKGMVDGNGRVDGSMSAGVGFGDPVEGIGIELSGNITSLRQTFGDSGQAGVKIHRIVNSNYRTSVAIASTDAVRWGQAKLSSRSQYIAVTSDLPVRLIGNYPLSVTLGAGNGSYRSLASVTSGDNKLGVFGSIGTQLSERTALSISQLGGRTNVGLGLTPFNLPISVMVGLTDISGKSTAGKQLSVNVGYAYKF